MSLVPKEILLSHLQRAEGAEEVTLPIDFFRDLLYQSMPRTWVGLTDEEIWDAYMKAPVALDCNTDDLYAISRTVEAKLKEKNT
jgi:hypothetical protein